MDELRKAAQDVLGALEEIARFSGDEYNLESDINRLRAALAAPPEPPVEYTRDFGDYATENVMNWLDIELEKAKAQDDDDVGDALRWLRANLFGIKAPRRLAASPAAPAAPYYIGGPYADGSYSMCELSTGRIVAKAGGASAAPAEPPTPCAWGLLKPDGTIHHDLVGTKRDCEYWSAAEGEEQTGWPVVPVFVGAVPAPVPTQFQGDAADAAHAVGPSDPSPCGSRPSASIAIAERAHEPNAGCWCGPELYYVDGAKVYFHKEMQ